MIEPSALALSIAMLLSGIVCVRYGCYLARPRPYVRTGDPLFEANILVAYGETARARALLEQACATQPERRDLHRRLAEIAGL